MSKNDITHKFKLEISTQDLELSKNSILKSVQSNYSKPGFRKGKVPLNEIEKDHNMDYMVFEAEKKALEKKLHSYLEGSDKNFYPDSVKVNDRKEEKGIITFECEVEIQPEIKVPKLEKVKGLKKYDSKVDDKEFDTYKDSVVKSYATWNDPKDKNKPEKDSFFRVKIDLLEKGKDSVIYPRSWFSNDEIIVFPGFDKSKLEKLLKDGELTYKTKVAKDEKDFDAKDVLGKELDVKMKFLDHKIQVLPEFDENMAKSLGFSSLKEAKTEFVKAMETRKLQDQKLKAEDEFLETNLKKVKFELPNIVIERAYNRRKKDIELHMKDRGVSFDDYLKAQKQSIDDFEKSEKEKLKPMLRKQMLLDAFITEYSSDPSEKDIRNFIEAHKAHGHEVGEFEAVFSLKQTSFFEEYLHGKIDK